MTIENMTIEDMTIEDMTIEDMTIDYGSSKEPKRSTTSLAIAA